MSGARVSAFYSFKVEGVGFTFVFAVGFRVYNSI